MPTSPIGFMSYVRFDDDHENGRLSELCKRLTGEIRMQSGDAFRIFQDRDDITWGQQWRQRIEGSIDGASFLIAIITPGFFKSVECRREFERFVERERELGRGDLILPIYYVTAPQLASEAKRASDAVATAIAGRQHIDWRELRFEALTSPQVGKTLERMARQIVDAMERDASADRAMPPVDVARPVATVKSPPIPVKAKSVQPAVATPRTEPPTRIVDALHRGDHATVVEALQAARPGDRIVVRPGLYRGGLHITKAVEIVGDGDVGEIVIEASGADVVLFNAAAGRISNVTLRQTGDGKWYGVDITQGRLDLEGCDISSRSLACVAIHDGADPRIRGNRIHDGADGGIFVYKNGQGTIEDNDIFGNSTNGVSTKDGANPTLRRNRIYDGKGPGFYAYEGGLGVVEDNDIQANATTGVCISDAGNPIVRRNRIVDNRSAGVLIYTGGLGLFEDNDVRGNGLAGVEVKGHGTPTFRGNRINENLHCGVFVHLAGLGLFEDNDVCGNRLSGVEVKDQGAATFRRNRINRNARSGVLVYSGGIGVFEDNDVSGNREEALNIDAACRPFVTLRNNQD